MAGRHYDDRESSEHPASKAAPLNRRREIRVEDRHWYTYEMYESHVEGAEAIVEGNVFSLNRSAHGILLLMREPAHVRHVIVLYNPQLGWYRSTMVYEIRWVGTVAIESEGGRFLVGCRQTTALSR